MKISSRLVLLLAVLWTTAAETQAALAFLERDEAERGAAGDKTPRESAWVASANEFSYLR